VNLIWYYNCPNNSAEYTLAMTDIEGQLHQRTVLFGQVRSEVWAKQQAYSNANFAAPIKEIVGRIDKPFVTAINDCIALKPYSSTASSSSLEMHLQFSVHMWHKARIRLHCTAY
jgi:hypothetical protein